MRTIGLEVGLAGVELRINCAPVKDRLKVDIWPVPIGSTLSYSVSQLADLGDATEQPIAYAYESTASAVHVYKGW
jgi:hypothetical protein